MSPRLMALAASVVLCAAILLSTVPGMVEAAPGTDPAQALDKLFADNALTDSWKGFKKYFVEAYEKDQLEAVTPLLKSLAADPVKAIAVVSGFGEDLAKAGGEPDLVVVLDAIGRMLGFQVPAEAPKFALSEDPKELVDAIYVTIEAAGGLAVTATNRSLFKNDRFTTHGMLATTVYRMSENIYMNYEASEDLAKSLSKTKTQVWIDVMTMLRSSADVDVNLIWMSMREISYLSRTEVLDHIFKVLSTLKTDKDLGGSEGIEGSVLMYEKYGAGKVIVGGIGKNKYTRPAALIIDLAGSDEYEYSACSQDNVPCSVVIDFSGSDKYVSSRFEGRTVGGILGSALLIDREGTDSYTSPIIGLGAGIFGFGVLIDEKGDDKYNGGDFTCGAGMYGIGILWDKDGNDLYKTANFSQGFAGPRGVGLLLDSAGNDRYEAMGKSPALDHSKLPQTFAQGCALGFNPLTKDGGEGSLLAAGGIGMLVDRAGNDRYEGGYCSQGVANYRGVGLLYDVNGTDNYSAGSLSQGTGVFHGFGFLVDGAGADTYNTNGSNAQGCGYDGGLGLLLEVEGKDVYNAIDSAQAVSAHSGAGILIDLAGNDSYKAKSRCHAAIGDTGEHWEDDWPSVAILLDFGADRNVFAGSGRADKANHADKMLLFYCTAKSIGDALKARMGFE